MKAMLHNGFWWVANHTYKCWPDGLWLRMLYRSKMHRRLNLRHPQTFTEKLQWLKLHDRNARYTTLVDKYEVKQHVAALIGQERVIPTLGVWDRFDDIDFGTLPDQFVLKCTHDSGNVWICKSKSTFNMEAARQSLCRSLRHNFYWWTREWPYKDIKARIIAEKYMSDGDSQSQGLVDYKFYCFNGEPKIMLLATGRYTGNLCFDYYDMQWRKLPLQWDKPTSDVDHPQPEGFHEMADLCRKLARGIPHVRIDLYSIAGTIYFGEYTFFDNGGFCHFSPAEWDGRLGAMISLPHS